VSSEDLLSGRGSEVVHHWREDFHDGVRAGVFGGCISKSFLAYIANNFIFVLILYVFKF
jgi:hypothetical protein